MVGGQHHPAHYLRLDRRAAERLGLERGGDDDVGQQVRGRHVAAVTHQAHLVMQTRLVDGLLQLVAIAGPALVVAGQEDQEVALALRLQPGGDLDHQLLALPAGQAAGQQDLDPRIVGRDPELFAEPVEPLGADHGRIEPRKIDAAGDGHHLGRVQPVLGQDVRAGVVGIGDHRLALGHHRVVPALEPALGLIDPVIGGHEWDPRRPRGPQGAEGRRAGTGVDQADGLAADQLGEAEGVGDDGRGVLGLDGQLDQFAAVLDQVVGHAPAARGDDRPPARAHHRGGDIEGGLLGAAGFQFRRDLQEGEMGG